jgi:glycosyltransferase involved in cell wall biosynthesis
MRECFDSVLKQTYENIELIIINDGSTDAATLSVLAEYEQSMPPDGKAIVVCHKENGGQGSARNAGMALAKGDYWLFLDSDDYYMLDTFIEEASVLLQESQADMCSFQYAEFFGDDARPPVVTGDLPRERVFKQPTDIAAKALLSAPRRAFSAATHTKILKASLMRENNIVSLEGLKNEDVYLSAKILSHAKTFDRYDKAVYGYRRANANSISTRTDNNNSFLIAHDILTQFQILLSDSFCASNKNVLDFLASPYVYWLAKMVSAMQSANAEQKKEIGADIKKGTEYVYLLKHSSRLYVRCAGLFIRIFGMKAMMLLLRVYLSLNRKHFLSINRKMN